MRKFKIAAVVSATTLATVLMASPAFAGGFSRR